MGLTPLAGLVMGTRSGDLDPAVVFHLHREAGLGFDEIETLLTKQSGLVGLAGAGDVREIRARIAAGGTTPTRPRRWTSSATGCAATSGRTPRRWAGSTRSCSPPGSARTIRRSGPGCAPGWRGTGWSSTPSGTRPAGGGARSVSADDARVPVLVVPTDEELEIARQTLAVAAP